MAKRTRKRYTDEQKKTILAAAQKDGLTAAQVQQKYGVKPITYYSWRKKTGVAGRRGRPAGSGRGPGRPRGSSGAVSMSDIESALRNEVQTRMRALMPEVVRSEVKSFVSGMLGDANAFVNQMLGGTGPRRRRRRRARRKKS